MAGLKREYCMSTIADCTLDAKLNLPLPCIALHRYNPHLKIFFLPKHNSYCMCHTRVRPPCLLQGQANHGNLFLCLWLSFENSPGWMEGYKHCYNNRISKAIRYAGDNWCEFNSHLAPLAGRRVSRVLGLMIPHVHTLSLNSPRPCSLDNMNYHIQLLLSVLIYHCIHPEVIYINTFSPCVIQKSSIAGC